MPATLRILTEQRRAGYGAGGEPQPKSASNPVLGARVFRMTRILVSGFPHTGTTIVRKVIGNHPSVYEVCRECSRVPEEAVRNGSGQKATHIVFKQPIYARGIGVNDLRNFQAFAEKLVLIIRNPFDTMGSIYRRFGGTSAIEASGHDLAAYLRYCEFFREIRGCRNVVHLIYEELFAPPMRDWERLFGEVGLAWDERVLRNSRTAVMRDGKNPHVQYRQNQINQPLADRTGHSKRWCPDGLKDKILGSESVRAIYANLPDYA
ncbi:MAG TPA: hypothetical protein VK598_05305 [Nitrospiraceae bacterium]|nr:hypothetical protein [Nitrospiraceae bacterium]